MSRQGWAHRHPPRRVPSEPEIARVVARVGRPPTFSRDDGGVLITSMMTQEEYCYAVQSHSCPITAMAAR
jgi:hypothetical protein